MTRILLSIAFPCMLAVGGEAQQPVISDDDRSSRCGVDPECSDDVRPLRPRTTRRWMLLSRTRSIAPGSSRRADLVHRCTHQRQSRTTGSGQVEGRQSSAASGCKLIALQTARKLRAIARRMPRSGPDFRDLSSGFFGNGDSRSGVINTPFAASSVPSVRGAACTCRRAIPRTRRRIQSQALSS